MMALNANGAVDHDGFGAVFCWVLSCDGYGLRFAPSDGL